MSTTQQLSERLQRLYAAVGAVLGRDEVSSFKPQVTDACPPDQLPEFLKTSSRRFKLTSWDFGGGIPQAELDNKAWAAIHNTSIFYDHCCTWAHQNNIARDEVNAVTAGCLALRIIRDLDVSEKHPQTRANTCGLSPQLANIQRVLQIRSSQSTQSKATSVGGIVVVGGDPGLAIIGDVINGRTGKTVHAFPDIIEEGIAAWETFLRSKGALS